MPSISMCMIGQDEEELVKRNLEHCLDYVDEIVFVDGGSIDSTREIVQSIPKVRLIENPFPDNFSHQRNVGIFSAHCEYILIKDCDEVFEPDLLNNLQRLTSMDYDAFAFPRKTYIDGHLYNINNFDYTIRFWKNGRNFRYQGIIHEGVIGPNTVLYINAYILHQKTIDMQHIDNMKYWDLGQTPTEGWSKQEGKWVFTNV